MVDNYDVLSIAVRSVIVLCNNMSANDIRKLVPECSEDGSSNSSSFCMKLASSTTNLLDHGCQDGDGNKCSQANRHLGQQCDPEDVNCKLLAKVKQYLARKLQANLSQRKVWFYGDRVFA